MKIVGFAQLRNELSKGNLKNWFMSMSFCDEIYIYDQNSDDGSKEYYKNFNAHVIESPINNFVNEIKCKRILLEKLLKEQPDADWIFWMDGDTILDARMDKDGVYEILTKCEMLDGILLGHLNLWRSDIHFRTDSLFHWLHTNGVCAFWKNNGNLKFPSVRGLHTYQFPNGMENCYRIGYFLIHRGFATDDQIINRIENYKKIPDKDWKVKGIAGAVQKRNTIERFLNESNLNVRTLPKAAIPDWFNITDSINPIKKRPIREIHEERIRNNNTNLQVS